MAHRIPFTTIAHNPVKPELTLGNGTEFLVVNTNTGALLKPYGSQDRKQKYTEKFSHIAFSTDGTLMATTSAEEKTISIWNTSDWSLKLTRTANKRVNAMQFDKDASQVIVADKHGDVTCHSIKDGSEEDKATPILGHVSMLTDMILTPDEKYVITADRDEHIRVSRFPNGYNIESFCLGHTDVVTLVRILPWNSDILVSAGGDSTLRTWDFVKGAQIQCLDIKSYIASFTPEAADENSKDPMISAIGFSPKTHQIVVCFAKTAAILVFNWNESEKTIEYQYTLETVGPVLDLVYDLGGRLWVSMAPNDESQDLIAVYTNTDDKLERVESSNPLVAQINGCEAGLVDKMPNLYSIFGLRKFLDVPEQQEVEKSTGSNKKRKVEN
ncbi:WD40-repeat-containing domain protein [Phycomyces nitens]|nr:WD40-repeat-containing domain protein [Phycomyces nitens]